MKYIRMGQKLKELRAATNLTQKEVADRVGVSPSVLSTYETEDRHPSYDVLNKLADLYDVSTDYLIGKESTHTIDVSDLSPEDIALIYQLIARLRR